MKCIVSIFFLLIPVLANCQTQEQPLRPINSADSLPFSSLNRQWSSPEFQQVLITMFARLEHPAAGIFTIDNSKPLFAKLLDLKNYWFLESKDYTLKERLSLYDTFELFATRAFATYFQKGKIVNGRLNYEKEVAGFIVLFYEMIEHSAEIGDELRKATPTVTQKQTDARKRMKDDLTGMMRDALQNIEKEYTYFSEASICKMSSAFKKFYSVMNKRLDPDTKAEFDKEIANIIKTHPVLCVRAALQGKP